MSNKKQSSVEWLIGQVLINPKSNLREIIEQAKEMHEEEVNEAYIEGFNAGSSGCPNNDDYNYYNETFNTK